MDKTTRRRLIFIFLLRPWQGHGRSGPGFVIPAKACRVPGYAGAADVPPTHTLTLQSCAQRPQPACLMGVRLQTAFSIRDLPPQSRQSLAEATKRLIPWIAPL